MERIEFTEELNIEITSQVDKFISKTTCQLFISGGKYRFKAFGTGVFIKLSQDYFLITASHVAEEMMNGIYIFTKVKKFILLSGEAQITNYEKEPKIDVAYIKLEKPLAEYLIKEFEFLNHEDIEVGHIPINATQYLVFGYPAKNISVRGNKISTKASLFLLQPAKDNVYEYYKFYKNLFYALEFKGRGLSLRTGNKSKKLGSQAGLSGGGLWLMYVDQEESKFVLTCKLIGLMTDERAGKFHCLIGNKIESLISGIAQLENNLEAQQIMESFSNTIYIHSRDTLS